MSMQLSGIDIHRAKHNGLVVGYAHYQIMHIYRYAICTYPELSSIEIPCIKTGLTSFYAHKRIMHLSIIHLSGVVCTFI